MTHAEDQLHLMIPQRFFTYGQRSLGDRHVYAQRTRFIASPVTYDPAIEFRRLDRHSRVRLVFLDCPSRRLPKGRVEKLAFG
jgi:hypothetical protein